VYRRGGVIAGTSAGAAIMSKTMFYEGRAPLPTLRDGITDGRDIAPGLGFIGDDVFVDQHLLIRGRFARMLPAMLAKHYRLGLGIDENTAAVVGPDRSIAVIGYKGALLLDLARATVDSTRPAFNVADARISYLDSGDRYDPATDRFTPGPDKEKVDPADPSFRGPLFVPDILGNTAVVDLLMKLCDSDQARATGIAFGDPAGTAPDRGFEFTFTRMPDTEGWTSTKADTYSVYRVRMDVRPIRLTLPLYRAE
jgi:cyanophycinase